DVDAPGDAHLPGRAEEHRGGRHRGPPHRRRLRIADLLAGPFPAAGPGRHLQRRHRAARLDERVRHRAGAHRRRPGPQHRDPQHLHLPHVRPGAVRAGHDHEPGALPDGGAAGLPGDPVPAQEGGDPVTVRAFGAALPDGSRRLRPRGLAARLRPIAVVALLVPVMGVPLWLIVATAGKSQAEALSPNLSPPSRWQLWENLAQVWQQGEVPAAFLGSVLVVAPSVALVLTLDSMASWVLARRGGRFMAVLYALAISGIVLPPAVVTIVLLLRQLGLAGSPAGMIGVYAGIYMSTVIFFVTGFIRTVPVSLEEAARMDGA